MRMVSHSACQAGVSIKKEEFVTKETFEMLIPGLLRVYYTRSGSRGDAAQRSLVSLQK